MFLADSVNWLVCIMEVQIVCIQLGNDNINVIQTRLASLNITWHSAKGRVIELRRREPQNCRMLLPGILSLALAPLR
jgi:hypothetical protein